MSDKLPPALLHAVRNGGLVVMAGAGVSIGKPSALPGWKPLNEAISRALANRLEVATERPGWLEQSISLLRTERDEDRFPPEYQAQLLHEMTGIRYFQALSALNVSEQAVGGAHDAIAALGAAGALRAVVTTNFDCLIEHALRRRGIQCHSAHDDSSFAAMAATLRGARSSSIPIIKIHGCASDAASMIDTLKQRVLGRSQHLHRCLEALYEGYWAYVGFSAADLEGDRRYLGLLDGARRGIGATYIAHPGSGGLSKGAQLLMDAYGDRGTIVSTHVPALAEGICDKLGVPGPQSISAEVAIGRQEFDRELHRWCDGLTVSGAGVCLAALFEAIGRAEDAVRLLDRLVRKEPQCRNDGSDYRALQLHYGRLGATWGRFINVPDLQGAQSNASVESVQSLYRLADTEHSFASKSWLPPLFLWLGKGSLAMTYAVAIVQGMAQKWPHGEGPQSDEEAVDAWLSASQVLIVNTHPACFAAMKDTVQAVVSLANRCGDPVRLARVRAIYLMALAESSEDLPSISMEHDADFREARRVGDLFALGMRDLALGRWHVASGGLALAAKTSSTTVAHRSIGHLVEAITALDKQGMDPWIVYAHIQLAKVHADLKDFDGVQRCMTSVENALARFPIWASHYYEAAARFQAMLGSADANQILHLAIDAANQHGLLGRKEFLRKHS